jgi:hypothetical protein
MRREEGVGGFPALDPRDGFLRAMGRFVVLGNSSPLHRSRPTQCHPCTSANQRGSTAATQEVHDIRGREFPRPRYRDVLRGPPTVVDLYDLRQAAIPISPAHCLESILEDIRAAGADVADMTLFAIGLPRGAKASRVDLEQNRIVSQPMELRIQYKYASAEQPDRHIGRIVQFELDDLDGTSGSPVFLRTTRPDELPRRYILVGMLVRASKESVEFASPHAKKSFDSSVETDH